MNPFEKLKIAHDTGSAIVDHFKLLRNTSFDVTVARAEHTDNDIKVENVARALMECPDCAVLTWANIADIITNTGLSWEISRNNIASYATRKKKEWNIIPREERRFNAAELLGTADDPKNDNSLDKIKLAQAAAQKIIVSYQKLHSVTPNAVAVCTKNAERVVSVDDVAKTLMECPQCALLTWDDIAAYITIFGSSKKISQARISWCATKMKNEWNIIPREKLRYNAADLLASANNPDNNTSCRPVLRSRICSNCVVLSCPGRSTNNEEMISNHTKTLRDIRSDQQTEIISDSKKNINSNITPPDNLGWDAYIADLNTPPSLKILDVIIFILGLLVGFLLVSTMFS